MLRFLKQTVWWAACIIGCQSAFGFALIGPIPSTADPVDSFEVPDIAYALPGDIGTPKNLHEEYRRNTPVLYYAFDTSFIQYFGTNGMAEVDKAMAMYNSITNVSSYSADLSEFPLDSRRVNFRAAEDFLWDLKSVTMGLMTEQLGFFEPVRWVWALHARGAHINGFPPCPAGIPYTVFNRNFELTPSAPDTYPTTTYVNGVLYSYFINETCTTTPEPEADAIEEPVDPLSSPYSAVADFTSQWYTGLQPGAFYTTFTRDDVGALRYLINTNNINNESSGVRTTEFITNGVLTATNTLDLNLFAQQARTNNAAALAALYPGLVITSTSNTFALQITTNVVETLVNNPLDPAGFLPSHPAFSTNYTTNLISLFQHTFANVVTNTFATRGLTATATLLLQINPLAPAGTLPTVVTNVTPIFSQGVFGDFFILSTNACGAQILSNLFTTVIATTNPPTAVSNVVVGGTNSVITFTPGSVTFFTNHEIVFIPVVCPVDRITTRQGIDRIQFVRRDYDSLIGQAWDPVTNDYALVEYDTTNSVLIPRHAQRRVPRPDFLFTAVDFAANNTFSYSNTVDNTTFTLTITITGVGESEFLRTINFDSNSRDPNLAGPGTIEGPPELPTLFVFNELAPLFGNGPMSSTNSFLDEGFQSTFQAYGSFDGTTNPPIVYPNGTSLGELEGQFTAPFITTRILPNASVNMDYSAQLAAQGGQAPYTWSLAPTSAGLPAGLTLSPDGSISGTPTGPAAIYDFTVRVTDTTGAYRDEAFTITVF